MKNINAIDLFCGIGGSSSGAQAAGADVVAGVDAWDKALTTFEKNFSSALSFNERLDGKVPGRLKEATSRVDLLLASPECKSHTCAKGGRERDEESRKTAYHVFAFVEEYRPQWIVVENVQQMRQWKGYENLKMRLKEEYYLEEKVMDAADFGVPQTRRRLFLVGDRKREPKLPPEREGQTATPARNILDRVDAWKCGPLDNGQRATSTLARGQRAVDQLGKKVPYLIVYYGSDGGGGWQDLDRPLRTITTLDRFALVDWRNGQQVMRMLQVPELKRAMGFKDNFDLICGSRREKINMLGNAVCPPVMEAIVGSLIGTR